jgi:hypothetical protein
MLDSYIRSQGSEFRHPVLGFEILVYSRLCTHRSMHGATQRPARRYGSHAILRRLRVYDLELRVQGLGFRV